MPPSLTTTPLVIVEDLSSVERSSCIGIFCGPPPLSFPNPPKIPVPPPLPSSSPPFNFPRPSSSSQTSPIATSSHTTAAAMLSPNPSPSSIPSGSSTNPTAATSIITDSETIISSMQASLSTVESSESLLATPSELSAIASQGVSEPVATTSSDVKITATHSATAQSSGMGDKAFQNVSSSLPSMADSNPVGTITNTTVSPTKKSGHSSVVPLVGGIIGGILVFLLLVLAIIWIKRKRTRKKERLWQILPLEVAAVRAANGGDAPDTWTLSDTQTAKSYPIAKYSGYRTGEDGQLYFDGQSQRSAFTFSTERTADSHISTISQMSKFSATSGIPNGPRKGKEKQIIEDTVGSRYGDPRSKSRPPTTIDEETTFDDV
ncbi:hypothetical protein M422DRAFT_42287 [Sphaerobolus stellatus SS14]|nr:hypothetical protein M422DRAFT_42287 [Sphaerobolus stellatus SS14]